MLLVDEVLAVGDEPFQRKCMEKIREFQHDGRTIVLVSHSAEQVAEVCDRAVVLEKGKILADGTPREALRRLRRDYEAQIQEDIQQREASRAATVSGPAAARRGRISGVALSSPGQDGESLTIVPGDDLTVSGVLEVREPLEAWTLATSIETPLGQVIFGTDTTLLDVSLPPVDDSVNFSVTLPALEIGQGDYAVNVAVRDAAGKDIDRAARAASFTVTSSGQTVGYLHSRPTVTVTR
ncbi:Wzt carbohydrate-binding domain-containing protein [Georgenia sp. SUBG003]|uniref:Wzt carbohydrate-binding domain-containing protein n=1 Tax=Georgenia sp. SUBG003 TaxID=1497974 RepID=UPI003AB64475